MSERVDAIVIGSGQGGKPLASALARSGRRTAVIERGAVGGTCVNHGCTPTKAMVASAAVAWTCRRAGELGVRTGPVEVDLAAVRQRKREIVERFRSGVEESLTGQDRLELVRGEARFVGERTVRVDGDGRGRELTAELVFLDTGLRPVRPAVPGLDAVPALDNASIMELDSVPPHLLVLGGGYVGCEFAQMFRRFGSEVTVVDGSDHLLAHEDDDVAAALEEVFAGEGITVLSRTRAQRVRRADGGVHLRVDGRDGTRDLQGSHLLLAAGREPDTGSLALEAAGVETDDEGHVRVDERLQTTAPGVYALGDVKGGPAFTHVSYNDYMILKANLLDGGEATTRDRPLLYTVFVDPQLGRVGLDEGAARAAGRPFRVAKLPMGKVARAMETGDTRGLMKAIVDADTDRLLGATVFGMQGGEVMSMLQIAMMGGLRYQELRDGMFAHPLLAESLNSLFASFED